MGYNGLRKTIRIRKQLGGLNHVTGLAYACIAPHGGEVIPELAGEDLSRMDVTRRAMEELGRRVADARPDTLVVLTPHGVRVAGAVCVMATERAIGILESEQGEARVDIDMAVDTELAQRIAEQAAYAHHVPTVTAIYGASGGDSCFTPLDWGAVVPLWFLGARSPSPPAIVSITPSRALSLQQLYDFGTAIAEAAGEVGRRVALVASADWGHAHSAEGPYGYDPASSEFDAMVQEVIRSGDLDRLLATDLAFAEQAKVDGLWQTVTLAGALRTVHPLLRGELLSYEAPTYFGMLVAAYGPSYDIIEG
jgi:aromatic ring-opening dioxygenase LigB subunit